MGKQTEIKLYGNIGSVLNDGNSFSNKIAELEKDYTDLTIRWHCYGGSVFEGNVIYNTLQRSKLKIKIIIDGIAASMGCFVLPAVENVFIAENGFGMIHRPSSFSDGDADNHLQTAKLLQDMENQFIKRLGERTGMARNEIKAKWFDGKDHWLNAQEMVKYGFAKAVVPATATNIRDLDKQVLSQINIESVYSRFAANLNTFPINTIAAETRAAVENMEQLLVNLEATYKINKNTMKTDTIIKDWEWYQANAQQELETMRKEKNPLFADLYQAKYGVRPQGFSPASVKPVTLETTQGVKNWDWYQAHDMQALERIRENNKPLFAALYQAKYGVCPQGFTLNPTPIAFEAATVVKDMEWYQLNAPQELEAMAKAKSPLFIDLYKAAYGVNPIDR